MRERDSAEMYVDNVHKPMLGSGSVLAYVGVCPGSLACCPGCHLAVSLTFVALAGHRSQFEKDFKSKVDGMTYTTGADRVSGGYGISQLIHAHQTAAADSLELVPVNPESMPASQTGDCCCRKCRKC
eukprot:COSAG02_NODE_1344_length_13159_cov_10.788208_12_plen_127_part_00